MIFIDAEIADSVVAVLALSAEVAFSAGLEVVVEGLAVVAEISWSWPLFWAGVVVVVLVFGTSS